MTKFQNRLYQIVLVAGDSFFFVLSIYLAYALRNQDMYPSYEDISMLTVAFSPVFLVVVLSYFIGTLYEVPSLTTTIARVKMIIRLHVVALVFALAIFYIFPIYGLTPKITLMLHMALFTLLQIIWRVYISHHIRSNKKRRALLVGQGDIFNELKDAINGNPQSTIKIVEHIEINSPLLTNDTLDSLKAVLNENEISLLIVDVKSEKVIPLLPYFYNLVGDGLRIYDVHKMYEDTFRRMALSSVGYFWFFENVTLDMRLYEIAKRSMDIFVSIFVAIIWGMLHPIVSYLIKREDGGSVFLHNQFRIGRHGKPIKLVKYRTMSNDETGV
jgi:hypothetical protein